MFFKRSMAKTMSCIDQLMKFMKIISRGSQKPNYVQEQWFSINQFRVHCNCIEHSYNE